ncbi:hypothetical protein AMTRI_Chr10g5280 [Amborella trichopoda]
MAVVSSPNPETGTESERDVNPNPNFSVEGGNGVGPFVCLVRFAGDSAGGALMGSIFGYGVHSLVVCCLKRLRGKDDVINAGVAGCMTGLALSFPGAPQALLQSCVTFGAFSCIIEGLNRQQTAMALPSTGWNGGIPNTFSRTLPVLPPFTLPLPNNIVEGFSSFCQSMSKPEKRSRH